MSKRTDRAKERNAVARAAKASARAVAEEQEVVSIQPGPAAEPWFQPGRLKQPSVVLTVAYLALLVGVAYHYLSAALARSWFYSSDEYVAVAEVIRFSIPDFHQRFLDWPGVPLFLIASAIWGVFARLGATAHGWLDFTYRHIDWLFGVTRFLTLFFYCVSLVMLFMVTRRAINRAAACIASLLLLMNPTYASYSSFTRPESLAVCLILGAVLLTYAGLEQRSRSSEGAPHWRDPLTWAGILMGIAVGVRINSLIASAPLIWMIVLSQRREPRQSYPVWICQMGVVAAPLLAIWGGWAFWTLRAQARMNEAHAYALLEKAALAIACLPVLLAGLYVFRRTRPIVLRFAPAEAIKLAAASAAGLVIGFPTLFTQFQGVVGSMEMYSGTFIDWYRTKWPLWKNIRWYVSYYIDVVAHDRIVQYLLIGGLILIILLRDRRALPYVGGAATFFVSRPLNLQSAQHHMIFWVPFYCVVASYPVGLVYGLWRDRAPRWLTDGALAVLLAVIATQLTNGPQETAFGARQAEGRMANIVRATSWMKSHLAQGESIATAYACFNSDVFYKWTQDLGVPVPADIFDPDRNVIWWGRRREIAGRAGFACITEGDIEPIRRGMGLQELDQATDPYHEAAFQPVASFGIGQDKVDVFHFDFRAMR